MLIRVKVLTGAKKYSIVKKTNDKYIVSVKEKPEHGHANKATLQILADYFKLNTGMIKLIKGSKQNHKIIEITRI